MTSVVGCTPIGAANQSRETIGPRTSRGAEQAAACWSQFRCCVQTGSRMAGLDQNDVTSVLRSLSNHLWKLYGPLPKRRADAIQAEPRFRDLNGRGIRERRVARQPAIASRILARASASSSLRDAARNPGTRYEHAGFIGLQGHEQLQLEFYRVRPQGQHRAYAAMHRPTRILSCRSR